MRIRWRLRPPSRGIMPVSLRFAVFAFGSRTSRSGRPLFAALVFSLAGLTAPAYAQSSPALLATRAELTAAATRAEDAATTGEPAQRAKNAMTAAAIRQRLRDGDLQVGDR